MLAQFYEVEPLKRIFDASKEIVKDININVNANGLEFTAMDNSHVAIAKVTIASSSCMMYNCETECIIGIKLDVFSKFLSLFDGKDSLALKYVDSADVLEISLHSLSAY